MNQQLKTILLTVLTLSMFVIALVELYVGADALTAKLGWRDSGHVHVNEQVDDAQAQANSMPKTVITFDDTKHKFGTLKKGVKATHAYHFKNTGKNPLLIVKAVASCGCTVPSYPKKPIPPGGEGEIVVEFNTQNQEGHVRKNVLVYSNAQQEAISIGFEADVEE